MFKLLLTTTGKTTFARMWQQYLINREISCLYFNAWESDFQADPLIPLIGEIQSQIIPQLGDKNEQAREYFEKAKKISGGLLRRAVPAALKIATAGVLDLNEITEEVLSDWISEFAQDRIDGYEEDKNTLEEFRNSLQKFVKAVSSDENKPIIFFIDELDRCRPNYAIELLERIKHIFSVRGIIFILILDIEQLESAVQTLYGINMNVDGYLRRFIDLHYQLPTASVQQFCTQLFNQFGLNEYFRNRQDGRNEADQLLETLIKLSEIFGLSLRVQEHCFTHLSIALQAVPKNRLIFPPLLAFLIILKAYDYQLYYKFLKGQIPANDVLVKISQNQKGENFLFEALGRGLEAYIVSAHANWDSMPEIIAEYSEKAKDESISEKQRERYSRVLSILQNFQNRDIYNLIEYLGNKVELLEGFSLG